MSGEAKGALVAAAAYAVMLWLDRRPPSWWYAKPRPERPRPPAADATPIQGRIVRRGPGRDLERRQP